MTYSLTGQTFWPNQKVDIRNFYSLPKARIRRNIKLSEWELKETLISCSRYQNEKASKVDMDPGYAGGRNPLFLGYREWERSSPWKESTNSNIQFRFRF